MPESVSSPTSHAILDRPQKRLAAARVTLLLGLLLAFAPQIASAADLAEAEVLFRTGRYDDCAKLTGTEIEGGVWNDRWFALKVESQMARGKYADAATSVAEGLRRFPASVSIRWLARVTARYNGNDPEAADQLDMIEQLVVRDPQRYGTAEGRLVLGKFFLAKGADARRVLDQFYDVVTKQRPDFVDGYLATAELALDKQDGALAAATLAKAPKEAATDPRYQYLLARAFADDDRARSAAALAEALKVNPRHVDSLLLQADQAIDSERYAEASETLKRAFAVNPSEPRAWAYSAVLAHLKNDARAEADARKSALEHWTTNPEVDHLIGRKLSQKYRFAEGSAYQKRALAIDPENQPAKVQLCQDLLRLGDETEGWKLADEAFSKDAYNVVAFNLVTLRDHLAKYKTLKVDGFVVRMDPREAELYGPRVLALLGKAKATLTEKYGVSVPDPVTVEIFAQKKDFAVRTFGLPGAEGFLGVCFGSVVTANSPASQGENPSNWEAVLWHEFCHVVTLSKTKNKMPRWLSEGISVYEEARQDPAWATTMSPRFRAMTLGDELTALSQLSSAFLAPKSAMHLQFAYHESAVAIDFLITRAGLPALKAVLEDLASGASLNEALPRRTKMTLSRLDADFAEFARAGAKKVASDLTWEEPEGLEPGSDSREIVAWLAKHPKSFHGRRLLGARLVAEGKWAEAKRVLEELRSLYPEYVGPENPYVLLAAVSRKTSDLAAERKALDDLAARDGDALPAYLRLMELDATAGDWKGVSRNARRMLAVNPLVPTPHRQLAKAAETLGDRDEAIAEYRALALLDETDPAETHFRLAKLLLATGKPAEARREALKALDDAPRFIDAHALLLEITDDPASKTEKAKP